MIEYKDASFYTEYFSKKQDFKVIETFVESTEKDEKNIYIGKIEVLNAIHPLEIRVEIPFTFPHNKLTFRTKSIGGYPHLIHTGNTEHGDWFCLNTPFAETAEEQLDQEVSRLKEWISRQMREDLPPKIEDQKVQQALAFANAYEWENQDEVNEFCSKAMLTFVGDFYNDIEFFKESLGYLSCIKSPDNRFYAVKDSSLSNYKLPYIIVDEAPKSADYLTDFIQLKEQYGWDEKICDHLLPDFELGKLWRKSHSQPTTKIWDEAETLNQIDILVSELQKEESYLPASPKSWFVKENRFVKENKKSTKILSAQKKILLEEIKSIKETVIKDHKYGEKFRKLGDLNDEDWDEPFDYEDEIEAYEYAWHQFALGIKENNHIKWFILYTNRKSGKYEEITFDLQLKSITLQKAISFPVCILYTQSITESIYFGRGSFSKNIKNRKIALIGLGAIGSMVASSLAHAGISKIGLWDNDIVEPGNICRSSYSVRDLGESKVHAISSIIESINPYIKIYRHGYWESSYYNVNEISFQKGSFYANINYSNQEDALKEIKGYDLIIDCTGSNEMLHFLSYAIPETDIISMCITNHANDLLCITSRNGNPFEQRKAYLSRIEQDTKNFYVEGSGCYSPTFLANNSDITALVNLALRDLNKNIEKGELMNSTIYSYSDRGIVADKMLTFVLADYDITLNVTSETIFDAEDIDDSPTEELGYVLGCYSKDGKLIMITHIVNSLDAKDLLTNAFNSSKGLIDYIGDFRYSGEAADTYSNSAIELIASKAEDSSINTNNPLLVVRNPDRSISFFLYINNELVKFTQKN